MTGDPKPRTQPARDAEFITALADQIRKTPIMPDETQADWNVRTLKEHLETILKEHDRRFEQRFQAQESALQAALEAKESDTAGSLSKAAITVAAVSGLLALASVFVKH